MVHRIEKVCLKSIIGKAKVVASLVCVAGVAVLIFYRGVLLKNPPRVQTTVHDARHSPEDSGNDKAGKWIIGSLLLLACCLCWTAWFLIQSKISKRYPAIYTTNALMFFLGFFQAAALMLAIQRSIPLSTLKGRIEIITVIYSGLISSAFGFLAMTWCVAKRGPVFPSVFTPLVQMFAGIIDLSLLHVPLYLGSVLGSILIIFGLYLLLWAKTKETEKVEVKPHEEAKEEEAETGNVHKEPPV